MVEKFKKTLLKSFIAPIALGLLFAQAIGNLAAGLAVPFSNWLAQQGYSGFPNRPILTGLPLLSGAPQLLRAFIQLLIWYVLLYWLYFSSPPAAHDAEINVEPPQ